MLKSYTTLCATIVLLSACSDVDRLDTMKADPAEVQFDLPKLPSAPKSPEIPEDLAKAIAAKEAAEEIIEAVPEIVDALSGEEKLFRDARRVVQNYAGRCSDLKVSKSGGRVIVSGATKYFDQIQPDLPSSLNLKRAFVKVPDELCGSIEKLAQLRSAQGEDGPDITSAGRLKTVEDPPVASTSVEFRLTDGYTHASMFYFDFSDAKDCNVVCELIAFHDQESVRKNFGMNSLPVSERDGYYLLGYQGKHEVEFVALGLRALVLVEYPEDFDLNAADLEDWLVQLSDAKQRFGDELRVATAWYDVVRP